MFTSYWYVYLYKLYILLLKHCFLSLCKLIYPGFEITQFFVHLILRIIENPLRRAFADDCQLHLLRRPGDVVWDAVRDGDVGETEGSRE